MSGNAVRRTPTLETSWEDLTDRHQDQRERGESNIRNFSDGGANASYVVGAIGAGKTQLLTHLYKYSYREVGQPALFLSMGKLLDKVADEIGYPEEVQSISQERFHDVVESIVERELQFIHERVTDGGELTRELLLLDAGRVTDVEEYASLLGISVEEFIEITGRSEEITFFVDEMEESYSRLEELIQSTTGPLRDTVDKVQSSQSQFYLIGGFGYASVHEIGEAEYRRVDTLVLPIIKPENVNDVFREELPIAQRNFVWWMSRGRPGWLETARDAHNLHSETVDGSYGTLGEIPNTTMSRVSMLYIEDFEDYCEDISQIGRDLTAYTVFTPTPTRAGSLGDAEWIAQLNSISAKIMVAEELTATETIVEAFLAGVRSRETYNSYDVSDQVIRRYLMRFLQSISNEDGEIVFGDVSSVMFRQGEICRDRMLAPLAERVHDLALEEAGEEHQETIDFLYDLSQYINSADIQVLSHDFRPFFDLFSDRSDANPTVSSYIGPGFGALVSVFPSLITNPRLTFAGTARTEVEQFSELVQQLRSMTAPEERLKELGEILMEDPR